MIKTSFINPFSQEAKKIITEKGSIESIDKENNELIDTIIHTPNQLQDDQYIAHTYKDLAIQRFNYHVLKNIKEYKNEQYQYLFNLEINEYDIVSFYILMQAIAISYGSNSQVAKNLLDSEKEIIERRLNILESQPNDYYNQYLQNTLNEMIDTKNLYWDDIQNLLNKNIKLNELILDKGKVIIDYEDFIEVYGDKLKNRNAYSVYSVFIGFNFKKQLIISLVQENTQKYMEVVNEKASKMVEVDPIILTIADELEKSLDKARQEQYSGNLKGGYSLQDNKPIPYDLEAFPPCARKCIEGIKSGGRNDAIVLFLTPFISYARLYPGIFQIDQKIKISDVDPKLNITNEEVIPRIYEAANSCKPPLFKDQPQEKININSKLGFGMNTELSLEKEGETQWYTPMSCEKIQLHMPSLCIKNKDCQKIGNPLTYYNRKRKLLQRKRNKEGQKQ